MSDSSISLSLSAMQQKYGGQLALCAKDISFSSVSTDTRNIKTGDIFIALSGPNFDGHDYLDVAFEKGASAAIVEKLNLDIDIPQWVVSNALYALAYCAIEKRDRFNGKVIAITGSAGKTTVKGMVNSILSLHAKTHCTKGNLNNHIGVPLTIMQAANDDSFMIVEAGASLQGDIKYLIDIIRPHIALATNILPAHIEGFGSIENIAREKANIYSNFFNDNLATAIVNNDSAWVEVFNNKIGTVKKVGFSTIKENDADIYAQNISLDEYGKAAFELCAAQGIKKITLGILGKHNVANALAAIAIALECDVPLSTIAQGLEKYSGDPGRMQFIRINEHINVIDDSYNANPGSVASAIEYLNSIMCGSKEAILVLGDLAELGSDAAQQHAHLGRLAKQKKISSIWGVGPLSKYAVEAFGEDGHWFENQSELVNALLLNANRNTTLLIKGSRSSAMENVVSMICHSQLSTKGVNEC